MQSSRNKFVAIAVMVFLVFIGLHIYSKFSKEDDHNEVQITPGTYFHDVKQVGWQQGRQQWEVTSKAWQLEGDLVYLEEIENMVLYEDNQPRYFIKAETGVMQQSTNSFTLTDQIIVDNRKGLFLTAQTLEYNGEDVITFGGNIKITIDKGGVKND